MFSFCSENTGADLVVGNKQDACLLVPESVYSCSNVSERINIQTRIDLIQDRHLALHNN